MLITLSYAETENNLQIISTIGVLPRKMDKYLFLQMPPLRIKKDWRITSTSPAVYLFNKLPT